MLRRFQSSVFVLLVSFTAISAAAQEPAGEGAATPSPPPAPPPAPPPPAESPLAPPSAPVGNAPAPAAGASPWQIEVNGYFRAPMSMGLSQRRGPDDPTGAAKTQVSYAPNRVVDSFYYSFAYTRLQELDWAEVMVHAKKPHVDAVVGWMGYWFQAVGFRNYDAAWAPGVAYVKLDTDF